MKSRLLTALLILTATTTFAQAPAYWQQEVDTKMNVTLDDKHHMLHGYEEFTYSNNSPDTLRYIYIHLWPNGYKHDHTAFSEQKVLQRDTKFYFSKKSEKGYIDSLQFLINGNTAEYYSAPNTPDIARIDLEQPLLPGGKIVVTTPFRVKIPIVFSRLGHTGQAYFISQWFPKPAVYDQQGWHAIPYLDQGEFYSNVGSYDVSITLPRNYIVMATGNCLDASENEWMDSLAKLEFPKDTIYKKSGPKSSEEMKTLHFKEENVHDFAWFADKRWILRKDTVTSPGSNQPIVCYAAFLPKHQKEWKKGTDYLRQTVLHYGDYVGPYPYKTIKAVEGDMIAGGGMEYPTVTIIDRSVYSSLEEVIVHEAGHNWFYGMLATNERDHAWMDEGMNTFYEQKTTKDLKKTDTIENKRKVKGGVTLKTGASLEDLIYYEGVSTATDQALEQTSANFTEINYGGDVYFKTAMMMRWLEQYMGEEDFKAGMHEYYNTWHFKHPYPADFKASMQKHTDKNIDWFFNGSLITDRPVEFKINNVSTTNGNTSIGIKNKTEFAAPVRIDAYNDKDSIIQSAWSTPYTGETTLTLPTTDWKKLRISREIPEFNIANSVYRKNGLFHRSGLKLKLLAGLNRREHQSIWMLPAVGFNNYDGVHLGLVFHNSTAPETKFRFVLAPLYSFGSKTFNGAGSMGYVWYPHHTFQNIMLMADVKSFNYDKTTVNISSPLYTRYLKIAPALIFTFKKSYANSTVGNRLTLKAYSISEDYFNFTLDASDSLYKPSIKQQQKTYGLVQFLHTNSRMFNPYSYKLQAQMGADFAKIDIEGKIRIDYNVKNKGLRVRAFAGKFISITNDPVVTNRYWYNTTYTNQNDYLYDGTYLGRSENTGSYSKQIAISEGGFKIPTNQYSSPIGRTDDWIATLNLETDLPLGKWPITAFLDLGTFADAGKTNPSGNKFLYDGGVAFHLPYNFLSVYVPLIVSKDFSEYQKSIYGNKQFAKSIVFELNLQNVNWLTMGHKVLNAIGL